MIGTDFARHIGQQSTCHTHGKFMTVTYMR